MAIDKEDQEKKKKEGRTIDNIRRKENAPDSARNLNGVADKALHFSRWETRTKSKRTIKEHVF